MGDELGRLAGTRQNGANERAYLMNTLDEECLQNLVAVNAAVFAFTFLINCCFSSEDIG